MYNNVYLKMHFQGVSTRCLRLFDVPGVGFFSKHLKDAILGDHHTVSDGQVVHGFLDHQSAQHSMEGSVARTEDKINDTMLKGKSKQRNLQDS